MLDGVELTKRIDWLKQVTPKTQAVLTSFKTPLLHHELMLIGHIDVKLLPMLTHFMQQGVRLHLSPCVPGVVFNDCLRFLEQKGAIIYGEKSRSWEELEKAWERMLESSAKILSDMGGGAIEKAILLKRPLLVASEATSSGVSKITKVLERHELHFPILNWNDIPAKSLLHNRYEVGSGIWYAFRRITALDPMRMRVLVIGFGLVGQSVASCARSLGAIVTVVENNSLRRLVAESEGFLVQELDHKTLREQEVIITATGNSSLLNLEKLSAAKDGVILANAGHNSLEIDLRGIRGREVMPNVEEFFCNNKKILLLAKGALLNLAAGGSAYNSFDEITSIWSKVIFSLLTLNPNLENKIHFFN